MNQECAELIERWPLIKEFKLPTDSKVIVIGAYKGLAIEALDELYHPAEIVGYEPQLWAVEDASERLREHYNCSIMPFGLWAGPAPVNIPMGEWHTDACSFINVGEGSRNQGTASAIDADVALSALDFADHIDLVVCNIEGGEYKLIPYLREKGWLDRIDRLAVQWHWFPELGLTNKEMDEEIANLTKDFILKIDERPAWSYFTKGNL